MRGGWTLHAPMFSLPAPRPIQLGHLTLQTMAVEPADVLHQLPVIHPRSPEALATAGCSFAVYPLPDDGVFVLCYFCDSDCLTFIFDAWSEATRGHLVHAREHAGIVIALLAPGGPTFVGGGTADFWDRAVKLLDRCRASAARRGPLDYLRTFADPDLLKRHLGAIPAFVRPDDGTPRPMTVALALDRSHASAFASACSGGNC